MKIKVNLPKEADCKNCNKTFKPKRLKQKFCSSHCRWINWNRDNPRKIIRIINEQK